MAEAGLRGRLGHFESTPALKADEEMVRRRYVREPGHQRSCVWHVFVDQEGFEKRTPRDFAGRAKTFREFNE